MFNSRELSLLLTQIESGKKLLMEQILKLFLPKFVETNKTYNKRCQNRGVATI